MTSLKTLPLAVADPSMFRPPAVSLDYQLWLHRIFETTAERCRELQREPSMQEALLQLRIRLLASGGNQNFVSAMRLLLRSMCEAKAKAQKSGLWISVHEAAPVNISIPEWLDDDDWTAIEDALATVERQTRNEMRQLAAREMPVLIRELGCRGDFGSQSERAVRLAGMLRAGACCDVKRTPQKRWSNIDAQMFELLLAHLPHGSPQAAIRAIVENHVRVPGVSQLLASAAWITGMRFIELFDCRLMQPLPGVNIDRLLANPLQADRDGKLADCLGAGEGEDIGSVRVSDGNPGILIVETAKTRAASPRINNKLRALILKGASPQDLEILTAAAMLKTLRLSGRKKTLIRKTCGAQLRAASMRAFPDRADPVTMHTLRHAFIEAARSTMDASEVAALSGHTSPRTLRSYGASRRGRKTGGGAVRWTPQPDPARAAEFRAAWEQRPSPSPAPNAQPQSPAPALQ